MSVNSPCARTFGAAGQNREQCERGERGFSRGAAEMYVREDEKSSTVENELSSFEEPGASERRKERVESRRSAT
jgi:hypothetical protein